MLVAAGALLAPPDDPPEDELPDDPLPDPDEVDPDEEAEPDDEEPESLVPDEDDSDLPLAPLEVVSDPEERESVR